jgi:hypothetical protein
MKPQKELQEQMNEMSNTISLLAGKIYEALNPGTRYKAGR